MRIWSIHPQHLDAKGLVALWRESLLAKHVLEGRTKGYTKHPQLHRFKQAVDPIAAINAYLAVVYTEAVARGYKFDPWKCDHAAKHAPLTVTKGQFAYEKAHLLNKLKVRDLQGYGKEVLQPMRLHPLFCLVPGEVEDWEVL
ncbi:MAG: hypothetical protein KBH07_05480 [Flavobacteriales bacterium]|nr:hypothetical protein [Flavobacteriales bacterium]MBP9080549.1 hypothetical protein [Flavobacteriales bacterium]